MSTKRKNIDKEELYFDMFSQEQAELYFTDLDVEHEYELLIIKCQEYRLYKTGRDMVYLIFTVKLVSGFDDPKMGLNVDNLYSMYFPHRSFKRAYLKAPGNPPKDQSNMYDCLITFKRNKTYMTMLKREFMSTGNSGL